jgi:hypothetical protein
MHDNLHPVAKPIKRASTLNLQLEVWNVASSPFLWTLSRVDGIKGNFDVTVMDSFPIVAAVISNSLKYIIMDATQRLHSTDIHVGEAFGALLAFRLAFSLGFAHFIIEDHAILVILTIISSWNFSSVVYDISLSLSSFQSWNDLKLSRCVN